MSPQSHLPWAPLHSGAGGKTGQWDRGGGVCVCVCMCVCVVCMSDGSIEVSAHEQICA